MPEVNNNISKNKSIQDSCPNGLRSWQETHFEITSSIAVSVHLDSISPAIRKVLEDQGSPGLYDLSIELTDKFENKFKNIEWGLTENIGEFYEEIEAFISEELG